MSDLVSAAARLSAARSIMIIPGFGVAAAGVAPQLAVLAAILRRRGAAVVFGVHPVAGRFPGHLNFTLSQVGIGADDQVRVFAATDLEDHDLIMAVGAYDIINPDLTMIILPTDRTMIITRGVDALGYSLLTNPDVGSLPTLSGPLDQTLATLIAAIIGSGP